MSMFRELSDAETAEFQQWATDNYKAGEPVNPLWHPAIRAQCDQINLHAAYTKA